MGHDAHGVSDSHDSQDSPATERPFSLSPVSVTRVSPQGCRTDRAWGSPRTLEQPGNCETTIGTLVSGETRVTVKGLRRLMSQTAKKVIINSYITFRFFLDLFRDQFLLGAHDKSRFRTILQDTTDGSLSGTKVRLRRGAGRSLADEGHVTPKRLGDTAVERHSSRNRQL